MKALSRWTEMENEIRLIWDLGVLPDSPVKLFTSGAGASAFSLLLSSADTLVMRSRSDEGGDASTGAVETFAMVLAALGCGLEGSGRIER
jgi:hypothetical protein